MPERSLLFLLGGVQFINIVDFMMVMPLGPDFATALGIPTHQLGLVAGAYTAAAAIAGLVGALFLDRFDRRKALLVAMIGLATGTAAGGFATGFTTMIMARVLAGSFGGPATSIAMSILTDAVPPARRGNAIGKVMGAFSVASVLGVPAGLELASLGGFRTPFFVIAALGVSIASVVATRMPPMRGHLESATQKRAHPRALSAFFADSTVLFSLAATAVTMMGTFSLIANLSSFVQFNLGYPRSQLGVLYMVGGLVSFFTMRLAGKAVDKRGSLQVVTAATMLVVAVIGLTFIPARPLIPVLAMFVGFMLANSTRMVALNALTTRVPAPAERARFMSTQSAVQHLSTTTGAGMSAWVLRERADHSLEGMPMLAMGAIALSVLLPAFVAAVAKRVGVRDAVTTIALNAAEPVAAAPLVATAIEPLK
jgi:predicted MFS family arabinose efflux permease